MTSAKTDEKLDALKEVTDSCWNHFRSAFQDGDDVVVEDENGDFYQGRLVAKEHELVLVRHDRPWSAIPWDKVEFVAHDGFPVRKIRKMTAEEATARALRTPTEIVAEALMHMRHSATFGAACPFVVGPCELIAVRNRGSLLLWGDEVETLVFRAKDGALMHNYCTDHLFLNL